jgi:nucleoside 2-deoxyribosyltransferase
MNPLTPGASLRDRGLYLAGPDGFTEPGRLFQADDAPGQAPPDAFAIGRRNAELIDAADAVLANLEGTDVDSGTAAEIGYAYGRGIPVVGFRADDRRTGENLGTTVNLQVEYFIRASGGTVHDNLDDAIASLGQLPPTVRA